MFNNDDKSKLRDLYLAMLLVLELILVDDSTLVGYKLKIKTRKQYKVHGCRFDPGGITLVRYKL